MLSIPSSESYPFSALRERGTTLIQGLLSSQRNPPCKRLHSLAAGRITPSGAELRRSPATRLSRAAMQPQWKIRRKNRIICDAPGGMLQRRCRQRWWTCSGTRWLSRSRPTGPAGIPSAGAGARERRAELPLLRRRHRRARGTVGRADHHLAVALRGLQLILRGAPRGVRRRRRCPRTAQTSVRGEPGRCKHATMR